jgi:hypothetical protein
MPVIGSTKSEILVFRFEMYDITKDEYVQSARLGTAQAIEKLGARRIPGHIYVPASTPLHDGLTDRNPPLTREE